MSKKIKHPSLFLLSSLTLATLSVGLFSSIAQAKDSCETVLRGLRTERGVILTTNWNTGERFDEKVFISKSSNGSSYYIRWNNSNDWFRIDFSGGDFSFTRGNNWQKYVGECRFVTGNFGSDGQGASDLPVVRGSATSYPNLHTAKFILKR